MHQTPPRLSRLAVCPLLAPGTMQEAEGPAAGGRNLQICSKTEMQICTAVSSSALKSPLQAGGVLVLRQSRERLTPSASRWQAGPEEIFLEIAISIEYPEGGFLNISGYK